MLQRSLFDDGERRSPLRSALEAALREEPDDLATHMAYADHLAELGDERGEFAQLQLALENPALIHDQRQPLERRVAELLRRFQRIWLGDLAPFWIEPEDRLQQDNRVTWRRGWIDGLTIAELTIAVARALERHQTGLALLREIRLLGYDSLDEEEDAENPVADPLDLFGRANIFRNLRRFQLGSPDDRPFVSEWDDLAVLIEIMPRLEDLAMYTHYLDSQRLFAMPLPHLRKLTVWHLEDYPLDILTRNESLQNLTHLSFWPHVRTHQVEPYLSSAGVEALLLGPAFPNLAHLELCSTAMGDALIDVLIRSGRLERLRELTLRGALITDAGATRLIASRQAERLDRLDLTNNTLSETALHELRTARITVVSDHQWSAREIGEYRHLWDGDIE